MTELLAGALVTATVLAYVLEPLFRRVAPPEREGVAVVSAEELVQQMRGRLVSRCPRCDAPAEPGSAFCGACGATLVGPEPSP